MKYQKYDKYKDSEIEWLGYIPDSWTVKKIKWESPVYRGASPRPIEDPAYFDDEGEYAWVRISDVTASNTYLRETQQRLSDFGAGFSVKLQPGSLFLSIAGSVGKPCITAIKCCIHDGFVYFPKLKIENKFLYYIFASGEPYKGLGKMGTQLNLNTETVGSIQIPIPTPNEQNSIVEFLDRENTHIDTLIEKKQKLIELLKEKRTALITKAVTKGLNPDVKMKDSGIEWLGEVPEHWDNWKLAHGYGLIGSGTTPKSDSYNYYDDGEVPWVTTSELRESVILDTKNKLTKSAIATYSSLKKYPKGTLIMAMYGATIGRLGILGIPATVNQACCAFSHPIVFDNYFVYYWLWMARPVLISLSYGGGQPNLNQDMLKKIVIPIPELEEQREIVNYLGFETKKIDDLVEKIEQAIIKHQEYRTAIISAAVTGKIKVTQD